MRWRTAYLFKKKKLREFLKRGKPIRGATNKLSKRGAFSNIQRHKNKPRLRRFKKKLRVKLRV